MTNIRKMVIFSLLSMNCLLFGQFRVAADLSGEFKAAYDGNSTTSDVETGITIGYDVVTQDQGMLKLGIGGEFMIGRGSEDFGEGKAAFHSVYGFGKYSLNEQAYGLGRVGYNFHTGDDDYADFGEGISVDLEGGMMYSIGGGFLMTPTIALEGTFSSHSGGVKLSANGNSETVKITYTRMSLGVVFTL